MKRALSIAWLALGCGARTVAVDAVDAGGDADGGTLHACPPAPLTLDLAQTYPCDFSGLCSYFGPIGLVSKGDWCGLGATCAGGKLIFDGAASRCTYPSPPPCAAVVVEGAACHAPNNGECFVPTADAGSGGAIAGKACACDMPGPIWRCVPGTFRPTE